MKQEPVRAEDSRRSARGEGQGGYAVIIHAAGPYDSDVSDAGDADRIVAQFARLLEDSGHTVGSVSLITGGRVREGTRDGSGGYLLADVPAVRPEPGLDPVVTDPVGAQGRHDDAVAAHDRVTREREAAAAADEQAAVAREQEAAAARAGQDEAIRERYENMGEREAAGREHRRHGGPGGGHRPGGGLGRIP